MLDVITTQSIKLPFGSLILVTKGQVHRSKVIGDAVYKTSFSEDTYCVNMGWEITEDSSYRATQMKKGIYLGHNLGAPCKLHIYENNINLYLENTQMYGNVLWSFALKYIFTKACLDHDILHLKAAMVRDVKDKKIVLILGKGGSGKTTLADNLCKNGYERISNTHCMIDVKRNYAWGINSWIRRRTLGEDQFYLDEPDWFLDGFVKKIIIAEGTNNTDLLSINKLTYCEKYYFIKFFSAAICNYDLKEEVFDYMADTTEKAFSYLKREDDLVKKLANTEISRVRLDSYNDVCLTQLIAYLKN